MKPITILLIIITILISILGIKIYNNNKEPEYSLSDIYKILDKAEDIKNYECVIGETVYKRKDQKIYRGKGSTSTIADYSSNKAIIYSTSNLSVLKTSVGKYSIPNEIYSSNRMIIDDLSELKLYKVDKINYNGKKCLKVTFEGVYENYGWLATPGKEGEYPFYVTIWINLNNGLIMKHTNEILGKKQETEYTYKFNTVKDEDVNPDLSGYKEIYFNN